MPLIFRLVTVFLLFGVHSFAIFQIGVTLTGKKLKWRRYLLFYIGFVIIEWLQIGLSVIVSAMGGTEDALWLKMLNAFLIAALLGGIFCRLYRIPWNKALGAAALGHFLTYTIYDFLTEAAFFYSPAFDGKYLVVATTLYFPYLLTLLLCGGIAFVLRKTGLSGYRKIVSRCPDCMMRTYLKNDFFVQELHIPV